MAGVSATSEKASYTQTETPTAIEICDKIMKTTNISSSFYQCHSNIILQDKTVQVGAAWKKTYKINFVEVSSVPPCSRGWPKTPPGMWFLS